MVTNTQDKGAQVMGNKHRYSLILWEWGGSGAGKLTLRFPSAVSRSLLQEPQNGFDMDAITPT